MSGRARVLGLGLARQAVSIHGSVRQVSSAIKFNLQDSKPLEQVYHEAKKSNCHIQIASQIYSQGARLPPRTERQFFLDLAAGGQLSSAVDLWRQNPLKNRRYWRTTGVLLMCKTGNIVEAEELASQGVDEFADLEIAKAHARHQNVSEALQWLKSVSPQKREPVMDLLASDAFNSRKINEPADLAKHIAANPRLLDSSSGILRGLSGSRIKLVDSEFWTKNHEPKVRSELLRQGVRPKQDTSITIDRCLVLLDNAISHQNHKLADTVFEQRPKPSSTSPRLLQLELRYYHFKKDYASAFACIDPIPKTMNMLNWSLVWAIMKSFNVVAYPATVAPNHQSLYKTMLKTRGIHISPKTLNAIIDIFIRDGDFGFLLAILEHWLKTSNHPLPKPTINYLSQRSGVSVSVLRKSNASLIVKALCEAYGADFEKAKQTKYLL